MTMSAKILQKMKPSRRPLPDGLSWKNPVAWLSTWFGVGLLRPAPGTLGTLAAMPFGYGIAWMWGHLGLMVAAVLLLLIGIFTAGVYGRASGTADDQSIVIDEAVGVWIAAIPAGINPWGWLAAFFLFRLFDITKPWPVSFFDRRCKGGLGVMMDDVMAGIYASLGVASVMVPFYYTIMP